MVRRSFSALRGNERRRAYRGLLGWARRAPCRRLEPGPALPYLRSRNFFVLSHRPTGRKPGAAGEFVVAMQRGGIADCCCLEGFMAAC
jgi:hypothetical protein